MKRYAPLVLAFLVGALAGRLFWPHDAGEADETTSIHQLFARAKAYYVNENNADYRRARLVLEPLGDLLDESVEYHLDLALIDLQEINYRVQDESRLLEKPAYIRLLESAMGRLERAQALDPDHPAVQYNLARTYKKLASHATNRDELLAAAVALLEPLTRVEPPDPSTLLIYGDLLWDRGDVAGAHGAYDRIVARGKDYVTETIYFAALNKKAAALRRPPLMRPEEAAEVDALRDRLYPDPPKPTDAKLERGRYTEFVALVQPPKTYPDPRRMGWQMVTRRSGVPTMGSPRFFLAPDVDGDGARDLLVHSADGMRLLRNRRNASFHDVTGESGLPAGFPLAAAAAGDVDNDGRCDLVVGGPDGLRLFLNRTDPENPLRWAFEPLEGAGGEPPFERGAEPVTCIVLLDLDHDGDLDVFAGGTPNRVYRTAIEIEPDGSRRLRFAEIGERVSMTSPPAADGLLLDVDDDDDVDLLVTGPEGNAWFDNRRELRFERRELPAGAGLEAADVDNDLVEEVRVGGTVYEWRDGSWERLFDRPALLDLDSDGVIDEDPFAGFRLEGRPLRAVGADLNRDDAGGGGRDLIVLTDRSFDVYLSTVDAPAGWIDTQPRGLKANELGIGTKLRLYAGNLRIGATCRDGLVHFALGRRPTADALLARWTNGVEQGFVAPPLTSVFRFEEREGEVGSCPFVYAFDGRRWRFVADVQSGVPLGLPVADGQYLRARSNESILVPGDHLRPHEGHLRVDLAEEFRELLYLDQVRLRAVDHPDDVRPVLNEGFTVTRFKEFAVHGLGDLAPPRAARDHRGRDVLAQVRRRDGRHAVVWEPLDSRYVGLAHPWSIELDYGDLSQAGRVLLVMDGWVEFPTASASIAASQTETVAFRPPVIEARDADGAWTVIDRDPGFPAGKGKHVLVDLTGRLPDGGRDVRLRISSTQRLHWDAFLVATGPDCEIRLHDVPLVSAEHRFRGIGERIPDPLGEGPWTYSHDVLVHFHPYDQLPSGMLTRYGDVRALVETIDDRYPVLAAGDVVELRFDPSGLPDLPEGWTRTWCVTTEGWVKDADLNQAVRESVRPLPFHGMSRYPYDEDEESHPHPDFVAEWFTRPARELVNPEALFR